MKKIIAIILSVMMLASVLVACGTADTTESVEPSIDIEETPDAVPTEDTEAEEPLDPEIDESVEEETVETE